MGTYGNVLFGFKEKCSSREAQWSALYHVFGVAPAPKTAGMPTINLYFPTRIAACGVADFADGFSCSSISVRADCTELARMLGQALTPSSGGVPSAGTPTSSPAIPRTIVGYQSETWIIARETTPRRTAGRPPETQPTPRTPPSYDVALLPRSG